MILGIDEVGRGPWAGPLVVGAVVLGDENIDGLTDSKKLTAKRRLQLNDEILKRAAGYGLGWVHAGEIDRLGLSAALRTATIRAVEQIKAPYHEIIIDGTINFLADTNKASYVTTIKKADLLIPAVSAASIIAKVARDQHMIEQDINFPGYNFSSNVGYGTMAHRQAIEALGITPIHRTSYAPLAKYKNTTTKQIGDKAEQIAAEFLRSKGHTIIARNWRTKHCEIDIVSQQADTTYFTEVKYRKDQLQGGGLAAITSKKLAQMQFAAELYLASHSQNGNARLAVLSLTGEPPNVSEFLLLG